MATNAKAVGFLELNIQGFDQALKTAKNLLMAFGVGFSAYKAFGFFKEGITDAIKFGSEMANVSRTMAGFDAGNILLVQKALEKTGMGAGEAQGHINDFIQQGRKLSSLFGNEQNFSKALKNATADYGQQASILTRSAKVFQTVWNTLESIGSKLRTYFLAMTEQFLAPLQIALDYLNKIDLAPMGRAMGKSIADAANIIIGLVKNGDMFAAIKAGLKWAFYAAIDTLMTGFQKAAAFLGAAMASISDSFNKSFFGSDFLLLLKNIFRGLGEIISAAILEALSKSFKAIGFTSAGGSLHDDAKTASKSAGQYFNSAKNIAEDTDWMRAAGDTADALVAGAEAAAKVHLGESEASRRAAMEWGKMADKVQRARETAGEMAKTAGSGEKAVGGKSIFTGDPARAIADNLAKVGGGGNFLRVGQSMEAKQLMATERGAKASEEMRDFFKRVYGYDLKERPATLARGN